MFKLTIQKSSTMLFAALLGSTMLAQNVAAQSNLKDTFDEIVVTATKKKDVETVQDVAVAVTAFNEATLEALKVRDLESLSFYSPNVSLDQVNTNRGTANFAIRGLGINSSIPSIDPAVGVFIDGVYLGTNGGVVFDLFDLESVEILRGPQGLLFGRNTTGGAVLINTTSPSDEFEAKLRVSAEAPGRGSRGGLNKTVQYLITGPLSDDLRGKISIYHNDDAGYFKNRFDNTNHGAADTIAIRAALEWDATDALTLNAKYDYFNSNGDGPAGQNHAFYSRDSFDFSIDEKGSYDSVNNSFTLRADLDVAFGDGVITNIFGWREAAGGSTNGDIDALPTHIFHSATLSDNNQFSNELRYAGTFDNFDVTAGVFWFNQELNYDEIRHFDLTHIGRVVFSSYGGGKQDHTVKSVFGQVDYHVNDRLTGIFGLRYSEEEKEASVNYILPGAPCSVVGGTCAFGPDDTTGFTDENDWSNVTPKIGVQYAIDDNSQTYAHYVKGFRSGGYNFRITNLKVFENLRALTGDALGFDEEEVDSYEWGYKYQNDDGNLTVNSALFLTKIADMQREVNVSDPNSAVSQSVINTADATITGLELEASWFASDNLRFTGNLGLINAEYDSVKFDISSDRKVDAADLALDIPRVPEATYGAGVNWYIPLQNGGNVAISANWQHRDRAAFTDNNFGWLNEQDIVDVNVGWAPNERVKLSVYGKNLLDEVQFGGDTQLSGAFSVGGTLNNGVNAPYDSAPNAGTFSPLKKGAVIGIELTWTY